MNYMTTPFDTATITNGSQNEQTLNNNAETPKSNTIDNGISIQGDLRVENKYGIGEAFEIFLDKIFLNRSFFDYTAIIIIIILYMLYYSNGFTNKVNHQKLYLC